MDAKDYVDEVKLRLSRHDVALDLDEPTVLMYVNEARQAVQRSTMNFYPSNYGKRFNMTAGAGGANWTLGRSVGFSARGATITVESYKATLPTDVIDLVSVQTQHTIQVQVTNPNPPPATITQAQTRTYEARRVDFREMFNVMQHSFNRPTPQTPIYAIETNTVTGDKVLHLSVGQGKAQNGAGTGVVIWYVAALAPLDLTPNPTIEMYIPWQFQEMVVMGAMVSCLQRIQANDHLPSVKAELQAYESLKADLYTTSKQRATAWLPSGEAVTQ
jgi:hypothetical protein